MTRHKFNNADYINSIRKHNYHALKHTKEIEEMLNAKPVVLKGDVPHNPTAAAILSLATALSVVKSNTLGVGDNTVRSKRSIDSDLSMTSTVEQKHVHNLIRLERSIESETIQQFTLKNGNCLKFEESFDPNQQAFRITYQCFNQPCNAAQKVGFFEEKHYEWTSDPQELTITQTNRDDTVAIIKYNNPTYAKRIQCNLKAPIGDMPSSANTIKPAIIELLGTVFLGLGAINFLGFDSFIDEKEGKANKVLLKSDTEEGTPGYVLDAATELDIRRDKIDANLVGDLNNDI